MGLRDIRVTNSIPRQRIKWGTVGVIVLLVFTALFSFPHVYNQSSDWFKDKTKINLGHFPWVVPFHLGLDLQGGTHLVYEADVTKISSGSQNDAVQGVRDVIERRVNALGVSEPVVQTDRTGSSWRVIVELAGIKDVNQAIKMIGETPILEFKEEISVTAASITDEEKKAIATFNKDAEKKASSVLKEALASNADFSALAKKYSEDPGSAQNGGNLGWFPAGAMVKPFEDAVKSLKINQTTYKLVKSDFGFHIIKKTGERETEKDGQKIKEYEASHILIKTKSETDYAPADKWQITGLNGQQLTRATVQFDPNSGMPTVALEFNDEGKKLFGDITERNVNKQVAIFLDGSAISSPVVREAITDGKAVISGDFTIAEAKLLAQRLNAGALPVPITLISQQTIGASLGMNSLERSLFAGLIGFAAVVLFMLLFYRLPGLLAAVALILYTFITLAVFKMIPVTLSLAGIAGFILSIGMAVDANVLIFERTKEELRRGLSITQALNEGFARAWLSIRDSNASSLITCLILMWFGTSVVKGFAITLAIGILISMFSAITVTRILLHFVGPWIKNPRWFLGGKKINQ
ncbi:MAG: Protein translocase subunit SecD [Candidatus Magasanikbacteria bacterium GW2011_GWC2_40_17]|uniref:Protein translocase subunit SecD n=1 Tax=Candidatus Magasanikbacteria bacterium GW2011_GWA2_42_32 TaxID=1619039 RepID=A0A0G1CFW3_9BACT|nr:MAG: Protein translocase subunit SecD [Candidatus Magasanikbacteria bacterium GW2011_GWC2_40_17]KKS57456.1 MAG: Protein translocase subunit SecD [Candidatus Magasanikbacteria bacterium GW2011_GWA2_42_32]OGH85176.1 MAG: protein-export membrane protein SecD [Candidatus Magasanikbacteria bacterium RIFOXYB2_FULL_38_10]